MRLGTADDAGLRAIPEGSTVVFVMNHRSNMDYFLLSYLAAEKTALSYAVGEWARIWPVQGFLRATGAYFVRRDSKDPLYRRVLERWVAMATANGVPQAVYPEGGLSKDGALRPPKLGLLDYMLRGFDPKGPRDLVFVPVGVNYDRVLEDRTLLLDRSPAQGRASPLETLGETLRFVGQQRCAFSRRTTGTASATPASASERPSRRRPGSRRDPRPLGAPRARSGSPPSRRSRRT